MTEATKRLSPTPDTLRQLYLKSGNNCAFPNCKKRLFNLKGDFVGQVCHIEAAMPGGERFNKKQTNEKRRHYSNLLLMCYDHHKETDNVEQFTVKRMKSIKEKHELKFSDVIGTMLLTVTDHTTLTEPVYATNLLHLNKAQNWNYSQEELLESINELKTYTKKLSTIPLPSRELFVVILKRSSKGSFGAELDVSLAEIQQATQLDMHELRNCISILESHNFVFDNGTDDFAIQLIGISDLDSGWPVWADINEFCVNNDIDISQIIINLDFSILDN